MKREAKKHYRGRIGYIVAIVFSIFVLGLRYWDPYPIQLVRVALFDLYQQIEPRASSNLPVLIVDVDEASLNEFGQWPWSRAIMAKLIEQLSAAGAAVIGLDFIFPEPDRLSSPNLAKWMPDLDILVKQGLAAMPDSDEMFAQAIRSTPVVVGGIGHISQRSPNPPAPPKAKMIISGISPEPFVPRFASLIGNIPRLQEAASGFGSLTLLPEIDGIVRRIPTLVKVDDYLYPSLGVEMLRVLTASDSITVHSDAAGVQSLIAGAIEVPTDRNGLSWVRFNKHDPQRFISAGAILKDQFDPGRLLGGIVILGTSAAGLFDIKPTPMGGSMPGVEVWAQWLETSLFDRPLVRPNYIIAAEFLLIIFMCLLLAFLLTRLGALYSLITILVILGSLFGLSWFFFVDRGILVDVGYPAIMATVFFNLLVFLNYFLEERHRRVIRDAFEHYLSPVLVAQLAKDPDSLRLSGESREITSLFTDITDFTTLVESADPAFLASVLNEYLDGMCHIAIEHEGTIDKIIGDAIHVLFGAPTVTADHAQRAIKCALALDRFGTEFANRMRQRDFNFGVTRIGVNTGHAIVGNFGGNIRFDYTAMGDTINIAARMEGANKYLGTRICVSGSTVSQCNGLLFRPCASLILKGKSRPIDAFEAFSNGALPADLLAGYTAAYEHLSQRHRQALELFESILQNHPDDPLSRFHAARLRRGETGVLVTLEGK